MRSDPFDNLPVLVAISILLGVLVALSLTVGVALVSMLASVAFWLVVFGFFGAWWWRSLTRKRRR